MSDGNLLAGIGLDMQLITAGSLGGLVKSIFDRSKVLAAILTMLMGGATANYLADPVTQLSSKLNVLGVNMTINQKLSAFLVGMFAVLIVGWLQSKLQAKMKGPDDAKPS